MAAELVVCSGDDELAERAAELALAAIATAVRARGLARVALSGGSTPLGAYRRLSESGADFGCVRWFWVDERAVPPDNPRSNYASARRALLDAARIPESHVFRMRGEDPADLAAQAYSELLSREFGLDGMALALDAAGRCSIKFDLLVAGMGGDGHTASLFPGTGAVLRRDRPAIAVIPGGDLEPRVSLTRPVLISARRTLLLCAGYEKRNALSLARSPGDEDAVPARLFQAADPDGVIWLVDRAAAG